MFDQIIEAQRPRHVAPEGRSGCWERPQVVAVGRRSRLVLRVSNRYKPERPRGVAVLTSVWSWSDFMSSL
ncbi:hypothetical protein F2Q69_00010974 [Brassica cretica]|uniref:Uncharacterized protein n=1 Tax=Brassica cretica TaxID=69181 RepID=A0A8S9QMY8_BRACR|nr:hypothetical protein F2Q69_00010974 [Brassica cretica]